MKPLLIVNENDDPIGSASLGEARAQGLRHRVVRVLVFNKSGDVLLQLRGPEVTYAPNTWETSAAGFVDFDENYEQAALRELNEELGLKNTSLTQIDSFYRELSGPRGTLRQFIKLFTVAIDDVAFSPNDEVAAVKWIKPAALVQELEASPESFTKGIHESVRQWLGATKQPSKSSYDI
jgi:16S rRNA (adenine1518-N6/adenine1519-N6)-dimethyltransferase